MGSRCRTAAALGTVIGSTIASVLIGQAQGQPLGVTTIDVPGSSRTRIAGMNDAGDVVGFYALLNSNVNHAFIRTRDGAFWDVGPPHAASATASSINNQGAIVGSYTRPGSPIALGYVLVGGVYTDIEFPGATVTDPQDINERGEVCGRYVAGGVQHGFTLIKGVYTSYNIPHFPGATTNYTSLDLHRMTRSGMMTGDVRDARFTPLQVHGVVIDQHGVIEVFDYPGATITLPRFMADSGEIVGATVVAGLQHGFYRDRLGNFSLLDVPGAQETRIAAGNGHGYAAGSYLLGGRDHGFIMK